MTGSPDLSERAAIGIARRLLTDASRCPSCTAVLSGNHCGTCGVDLSGPDGVQIWQLSVRAARTLTDREVVLGGLRQRAQATAAQPAPSHQPVQPVPPGGASQPGQAATTVVPVPAAMPSLSPSSAAAGGPQIPGPWSQARPASPSGFPAAPAWSAAARRPPVDRGGPGVHGLLVGLGALLLAVAAVGFLVFSWRGLSLPGRATVIAAATFGVLSVASWLRPKLPETAEAVGALGAVLVLADCWAIRRTGLLGADRPQGLGYAAGATAVCALLLFGWALVSRVRAGSVAAAGLAPLAVLLLAARLDAELAEFRALSVGGLLVAALALGRERLPLIWQAERWVLRCAAGTALVAVATAAAVGWPGPNRAALLLVAVVLSALAQARTDAQGEARTGAQGGAGESNGGQRGLKVDAARSLLLRRAWSLGAGLCAGAVAIQAGRSLDVVLGLSGVPEYLPVTGLASLCVVLAAAVATRRSAIRRSVAARPAAFAAGVSLAAFVSVLPILVLAGWLPIRAGLGSVGPWSAQPGTGLMHLDPAESADRLSWVVALAGLALIGAAVLLVVRICDWPDWLFRPVRLTGMATAGLVLLVLPLVPPAPVVAVVAGLALISILLAVLLARGWWPVGASGLLILGWTTSALAGTLAVILAWSTLALSAPLTLAAVVALLLARRRLTDQPAAIGLAVLASVASAFAVDATAVFRGASTPSALVWVGLVGGLSAAVLIGLPRWWPSARPGRATWSGPDRLGAAVPGVFALAVGLLATFGWFGSPVSGAGWFNGSAWTGGSGWGRPVLLSAALIAVLTAAAAVRPTVARAVPALPVVSAALASPVLAVLAVSICRSAHLAAASSLLWAATTAASALVLTVLVLAGRTRPQRRSAAELGITGGALIALGSAGPGRLWLVLLVLAGACAAIATAADRRRLGGLVGVLLTASSWARLLGSGVGLVEAYSLPPATLLLALAGYRLRRDPTADPVLVLAPAAALGLAPSILIVGGGGPVRPAVLLITATGLVLGGLELHRRRQQPRLAVLLTRMAMLVAAATAGLRAGSMLSRALAPAAALSQPNVPLTAVELWTGPAALVLLLAGYRVMSSPGPVDMAADPAAGLVRSWPAYAPGLLMLLLPSLLIGLLQDGNPAARQVVLITAAGITLVAGSLRRLQAPVILGAGALATQSIALLAPRMAVLPTEIPFWGWLAGVGLGLLLLGAGYERRLRQLRSIRLRLAALR